MKVSDKTRVGFIGAGGMGRSNISAASHLPHLFQIVAICDANSTAVIQAVQEFAPEAKNFSDFHQMYQSMPMDMVVISLPHHLHTPAVLAALEHNINVLCEKPLCITLEEVRQIQDALDQSQAILATGFNKRYYRSVERAESLIRQGTIGEIVNIRIYDERRDDHMAQSFAEAWQNHQPIWRSRSQFIGVGGILNDTFVHSLSLAIAIIDPQQYSIIHVDGRDPSHSTARPLLIPMEGTDTLEVKLSFGQQGRASMTTSWAMDGADEALLRVDGTEGQIVCRFIKRDGQEFEELRLTTYQPPHDKEVEFTLWPKKSESRRQLVDFDHCIKQGIQPRNGIQHAAEVVRVTYNISQWMAPDQTLHTESAEPILQS